MKAIKHVGLLAPALVAGALVLTHASPALADHAIWGDFGDVTALTTVNVQARETFAEWTTWGSGPGGVTLCPNEGDYVNCWVYWQPEPYPGSTYAALRVEPTVYSHYHLGFEDTSYCSCFADNGDGGGSGCGTGTFGNCSVPSNYALLPRTVAAHGPGEYYFLSIEAWNNSTGSQGYQYWDLAGFTNNSSDAVNLWVLWYDNNWYELSGLSPGWVDVSGWAYQILYAEIGSDTINPQIDNVSVGQVYM